MIERIDNIIQLVTTGTCAVVALYQAVRLKDRAWSVLGLFSGVYFLGILYWLLFLLFYGHTTEYSYIPDLCWYSSYLFLMLLNIYVRGESSGKDSFPVGPGAEMREIIHSIRPSLWLVPVFTAAMCIFYMQYGDFLSNIIAALLMTGLIWHASAGFLSSGEEKGKNKNRGVYAVTLLFCFTEYALWTTSCFWMGDTLANPYFWFDLLLSITFLLFIPALRKAAGK